MANTIDLTYGSGGGIKYALDGLWKLSFGPALYICCGVIAALLVVLMLTKRLNARKGGISIGILAAACLLYQIPAVASLFSMVTVPMVTFLVVGLLCLFNVGIMKTRIGQQFRAVGQNRTVANASGIHVDHGARDRHHDFHRARRLGPAHLRTEHGHLPDLWRA